MSQHPFTLTDVFTDRPLAGNPLAVFLDAAGLSDQTMQAIARELGHSETTFVLPPRIAKAEWRLRCFTPTAEVFGAGHNALGAWWVLASKRKIRQRTDAATVTVLQELGEGVLPVEISYARGAVTRVFMTQSAPSFGPTIDDLAGLSEALGLPARDLNVPGLRPQAVSTGATHLLVPVRSLAALGSVRVEADRLLSVVRPVGCQGAYLFTPETREPDSLAHARAFFPGVGIVEDPATGSAAGPLAALLAAHGRLSEGRVAIIEQGDAIGRPSRIEVQVVGDRVRVGGRSVIVAEGVLKL
ncbi:MAG: PhzF family phenazine biosynthesis protein [Burkholderiales bacterium]